MAGGPVSLPFDPTFLQTDLDAAHDGSAPPAAPRILRTYDRWNNMVAQTDARNAAWVSTWTFNAANRLLQETTPGENGGTVLKATYTYAFAQHTYDGANDLVVRITTTRDANAQLAYTTEYRYDTAGNLVAINNPDGGGEFSRYDAFGNRTEHWERTGTLASEQRFNITRYTWDRAGRLASTVRPEGEVRLKADGTRETVAGSEVNSLRVGLEPIRLVVQQIDTGVRRTETYAYDALGRRTSTTLTATAANGQAVVLDARSGATSLATRTAYDLEGHVVSATGHDGLTRRTAYDALGRRTNEWDAYGRTQTWGYVGADNRAETHGAQDGSVVSYAWNLAGEMRSETSTARKIDATGNTQSLNRAYGYDRQGRLNEVTDTSTPGLVKRLRYRHDLAGNTIGETSSEENVGNGDGKLRITQDNRLTWDSRNRLRRVDDGRVHLTTGYDDAGNRISVSARYLNDSAGVAYDTREYSNTTYTYKYDAMNRLVLDQGDENGNINTNQGKLITWDLAGRRLSESWDGKKAAVGPVPVGEAEGPGGFYTAYGTGTGRTTEAYRYDAAGHVTAVLRDGMVVEERAYDAQDRVVARWASTAYADTRPAVDPSAQAEGWGTTRRAPTMGDRIGGEAMLEELGYAAENRLTVYNTGSTQAWREMAWGLTPTFALEDANLRYSVANEYDKGNLASTHNHRIDQFGETKRQYEYATIGDSDRMVRQTMADSKNEQSTLSYDAAGNATGLSHQHKNAGNPDRRYVTDVFGRVLQTEHVDAQGKVLRREHFMVANGEQLVRTANDDIEKSYVNAAGQDTRLTAARTLSKQELANAPRAVAVRTGDTLTRIAQAAWGDGALWFAIAEANGLSVGPGDALDGQNGPGAGAVLMLPAPEAVGLGSHFNAGTVRPYDPGEAIGDTTPNVAPPKNGKGGCGGVGKVIMAVVTVVVAIYTGGTALAAMSGEIFAAELALGANALEAAAAVEAAAGMNTAIAGAAGAAAGNLAGQVAGNMMGIQDGINFKSVLASGVSAGLTSGLGQSLGLTTGGAFNTVARAALQSTVTQGVNVALGLQDRFDWRQVAAAAVAAPLAQTVGDWVGGQVTGQVGGDWGNVAGGLAFGLTSQGINRAITGRKITPEGVAGDAFGYAMAGYGQTSERVSNGPSTPARSWDDAPRYGSDVVTAVVSEGNAPGAGVAELAGMSGELAHAEHAALGNGLRMTPEALTEWRGGVRLAYANEAMTPVQHLSPFNGLDASGSIRLDTNDPYALRTQLTEVTRNEFGAPVDNPEAEFYPTNAVFHRTQQRSLSEAKNGPSGVVGVVKDADSRPDLTVVAGAENSALGNGLQFRPGEGLQVSVRGESVLPPVENLYRPVEGFIANSYRSAVAGFLDSNSSIGDKVFYGFSALATAPLAAIDMMGEGLVNAPNQAARTGQWLARAQMADNTDDRVISLLAATSEGAGAFTGAVGPFAGIGMPKAPPILGEMASYVKGMSAAELAAVRETYSQKAAIFNAIAENKIASGYLARLEKSGTSIVIVDNAAMAEMGTFHSARNEVTVNLAKHTSTKEAVSTIVHEATHQHGFLRGIRQTTQYAEYVAFRNEAFYMKEARPSLTERLEIWKDVKWLYSDLPQGKNPFGASR